MNRTFCNGLKQEGSLCFNFSCLNQEPEIVDTRKKIIVKSAGKSQKSAGKSDKTQKTSLKKRTGSNQSHQQPKVQHHFTQEQQFQLPSAKYISPVKVIKRVEPLMVLQRIQIVQTPMPTANLIKYTPDRSQNKEKKVNFIYNNKAAMQININNMGVNDLQTFNRPNNFFNQEIVDHKRGNFTATTTAYQSHLKNDLRMSTYGTCMNSEKGFTSQTNRNAENHHFSPYVQRGITSEVHRSVENQLSSPGIKSQNGKLRQPITSLSSRGQTVQSIDGDSESSRSIAIRNMQDLTFMKLNSIQTATKFMEERQRLSHSHLGSSIKL